MYREMGMKEGRELRADRWVVGTYAALLAVAAIAWFAVVRSASGMHDMAGMGMVMAPTLSGLVAFVAAWTVMMAAMMVGGHGDSDIGLFNRRYHGC
jgi:hypothetical protein